MLTKRAFIYQNLATAFLLTGLGYLLIRACIEFHQIAWGTGVWLGEFSMKWGLGFAGFVLFCVLSWSVAGLAIWQDARFAGMTARLVSIRAKTGTLRMVFAIIMLIFPVWFLQYTPWGVVFSGQHLRWLLWGMVALGMTFAFSSGRELWSWQALLASLLLTSAAFSIAFALINVTIFPFSLGWSEGNRMWDYSMMFGRDLYLIPPEEEVFVLLDVGRQFIGGIPFLFPGVSILAERLWVGLTGILPYLFLGLAAFRQEFKRQPVWWSLGLLTFIFLKQGPIHPPLVVCAIAVALVWRSPLWVGIPLIFLTGYFAQESRFTWLFAPAIWIVLLEFCGTGLEKDSIPKAAWWRAGSMGISGAAGGYVGHALLGWVRTMMSSGTPAPLVVAPTVSLNAITGSMAVQPLLWYRLFPNATYGSGILLGLFLAIFPLTVLLIHLSFSGRWRINAWQKLAITSALVAFLVVGLIVSTKIGGGGDLHNLDMFLIGLFFTAVIAWQNGGKSWFQEVHASPGWVKAALVLLFVIPGLYPLASLRSFSFAEDIPWLQALTDVSDSRFIGMLPPQTEVDKILGTIRREVEASKSQGEILFMDQRQLLTFGYVKDVPFVPEYEKKVLMNQAMSANSSYFSAFYEDLAARRFSLIVSEPLRAPIKDSTYQFGEENNAWVQWVVEPVLCYYDPVETYRSVQIQLLVPKPGKPDCAPQLPVSLGP